MGTLARASNTVFPTAESPVDVIGSLSWPGAHVPAWIVLPCVYKIAMYLMPALWAFCGLYTVLPLSCEHSFNPGLQDWFKIVITPV